MDTPEISIQRRIPIYANNSTIKSCVVYFNLIDKNTPKAIKRHKHKILKTTSM